MIELFTKRWWVFLLRGLVAIAFGILAVIWPRITIQVLLILFGVFVLLDGVFSLIAGVVAIGSHKRWWAMLLSGVLGIAIGLLTFFWPSITGVVLLYLIGAWAVVIGIMDILIAVQLRREIEGEWMMILDGVFSLVIGVLFFIFPRQGALALVWLIGLFAIAIGIILLILAMRLRKLGRELDQLSS
jgi:uncharacterized membrane protein HdeD (DUF308 family)